MLMGSWTLMGHIDSMSLMDSRDDPEICKKKNDVYKPILVIKWHVPE